MAYGSEGKFIYNLGFELIKRYANSTYQVNKNTVFGGTL